MNEQASIMAFKCDLNTAREDLARATRRERAKRVLEKAMIL